MRHLLNPLDFTVEEIDELLELATDIQHNLPKYSHVSVSYTHLDVYKRQILSREKSQIGNLRLSSDPNTLRPLVK